MEPDLGNQPVAVPQAARASQLVWLLAVLLAGGCTVAAVLGVGASGRRGLRAELGAGGSPHVRFVPTAADALAAWQSLRQRGRVLVQLSRYLHFEEPRDPYPDNRLERFPYPVASTVEAAAGERNLSWVLMRTSIARRIIHVVPPEVFKEKCAASGCAEVEGEIRDGYEGLLRSVVPTPPTLGERVIVHVDASVFTLPSGEALWRAAVRQAHQFDAIVFNLAADNPQVPEQARDRLRAAAQEFVESHAAASRP